MYMLNELTFNTNLYNRICGGHGGGIKMADVKKNPTVSINLPAGMSVEQFEKLFPSFLKNQDYTKKRDKAVRNALNALRVKYPADYQVALKSELTKVGLTVKGA